jgi:phosphate uptake regulator
MTDHVARMVHGWFDRAQDGSRDDESGVAQLVDAIHRMIREAEDEVRQRCEEIAKSVAGPELGGQIALAIRTATTDESLPRRNLLDTYAGNQGN